MIQTESLIEQHLDTCDAVYRVIAEENRLLKIEQTIPGPRLLEKKKVLLGRLDDSLAQLRVWEPESSTSPDARLVERLRSRILQILHLDRENEQLLLRHSLAGPTARERLPAPSPSQLRSLYRP